MSELHEECGIAAVCHLPGDEVSPLCPNGDPARASALIPRMLLDVQNRGQLAAGMTSYCPTRRQLIDTYKEVGTVVEAFSLGQPARFEELMREYSGTAAIGHVRYATCGAEDRSYAQPFERHHIKKHKWFAFAFNGQLANYQDLRRQLLKDPDNYLARETDTEVMMHLICRTLADRLWPDLFDVCKAFRDSFDGAYSFVFLNALGEMLVMRDPYGIKPLSYALEGPLFAAASESVALINLGFSPEKIRPVEPGEAIVISEGQVHVRRFAETPRRAHCFFEWIYFSNVASTLDNRSVYMTRKALGEELADLEDVPLDGDTIVVPVPDTSKAAADAMAYKLGIPCLEGLIRNRYTGRTFIDTGASRAERAHLKYTPLREVLENKRVLLVEDSIVRSTTMRVLLKRMREQCKPREIHVRVACPPIISPCFYGIDMSRYSELFARQYMDQPGVSEETQARMAADLGADSLRYLPVEAIARAVGFPAESLCQACITGEYPTEWGARLARQALRRYHQGADADRTYDVEMPSAELSEGPTPEEETLPAGRES